MHWVPSLRMQFDPTEAQGTREGFGAQHRDSNPSENSAQLGDRVCLFSQQIECNARSNQTTASSRLNEDGI
jgi:hypothetical protein